MNRSSILDLFLLTRRRKRFPFVKHIDAWATVLLIDPFAIPLVILLSRKPFVGRVLPDHLSMFSLLSFFTGLVLLVIGANPAGAIACFLVSILMDCTDGKLARHLHLRTTHGAIADAAVDLMVHGPGFVVIAAWAYPRHGSVIALAASLLMAAYFSYTHLTDILRGTGVMEQRPELGSGPKPRSTWGQFCENRGLATNPFGPVEVCFLAFPVLFVWLPGTPMLPIGTALMLLAQKAASKHGERRD